MLSAFFAPVTPLLLLLQIHWARLQAKREDDRGITVEVMIITAVLAAVALVVVGVIARAIRDKGNDVKDCINNSSIDATGC
jgi:hypothetical protein